MKGGARTGPQEELIGSGVLVAVAGPSGAGKDSVINYVREHLGALAEDVVFIRRSITRPADLGVEDYQAMDKAAFAARQAEGGFAVSWQANGLNYGLPIGMDSALRMGNVVVANVSRGVIAELRQRYARVFPVVITAPAAVLATRLAARGRESGANMASRLERAEAPELTVDDAVMIQNDGPLAEAGEKFLRALRKANAWSNVGEIV